MRCERDWLSLEHDWSGLFFHYFIFLAFDQLSVVAYQYSFTRGSSLDVMFEGNA